MKWSKGKYGVALAFLFSSFIALGLYPGILESDSASAQDNPAGSEDEILTKTIRIHNNMSTPIYIILQSSITKTDEWLQALNEVSNNNKASLRYPHDHLYRVYVNGTEGIAPGSSVKVQVPFYTKLVANPSPSIPDQYINWWNGVRIYVYDNKADFEKALADDQKSPVTPSSAGPACLESSCPPMTIYSGTAGLTERAHSQLAEYTFGNLKSNEKGYNGITDAIVDYDISYVDHAYLPMAIEPEGNPYIGYTGSIDSKEKFVKTIEDFIAPGAIGEGWPYFKLPSGGDKKLPGAYNVFAIRTDLTPEGLAVKKMKYLWYGCLSGIKNARCDSAMKAVKQFFDWNYLKYQGYVKSGRCAHPVTNSSEEMLKHIYGWVPFNDGCGDAGLNALKDVPGYQRAHRIYRDLQIGMKEFNPYVEFIHGTHFLNMSAYAFSIDDAVGNMQEQGDGLIVTVGGPEGLLNGKPYDPKKSIMFTLGTPESGVQWTAYGACAPSQEDCQPNMKLFEGATGFKIATFPAPFRVVIKDSLDRTYEFLVSKEPPVTKADISNCLVDKKKNNWWCVGIDPNTQIDNLTGHDVYYVSLRSPPSKANPDEGTGVCTGRTDEDGNPIPCCQPALGQLCPPNGAACPTCGAQNCECPTGAAAIPPASKPSQGGAICTGRKNAQGNPIACCQPDLGQLCPPNGSACPTCGGQNCECPE